MNTKRRPLLIVLVLIAVLLGAGAYWWTHRSKPATDLVTLYGNIDIRQVQLAFNDTGRVTELLAQEGDAVRKGQLLARIDAVRYQAAVDRASAALQAQQQVVARLKAGSRPQEIAQARAAVAAAMAAQANAQATYARQKTLVDSGFLPRQSLDNVTQQRKTAAADVQRAQEGLSLALQGPRKEDIAAAQAQVKADEATLALAQRELADTALYAPDDGVVESRILEVGDMAAPQTPVLTLALNNPVWVRAYVPETELGKIAPGMRADILSDSFAGKRFAGWIGDISPTAEFTPKSVETTELRTQLVYRVRVYACNPGQQLRLGMPVTVQVPLRDNSAQGRSAHVCQH